MGAFRLIKHLLPRSAPWAMYIDRQFTRFMDGSVQALDKFRTFVDLIWLDIFPQTSRELLSWEKQWALPPGTLTDQQRRDRLDAVWKAAGAQGPEYLEDTLTAAGFPVFAHPWWDVTAWGVLDPKDPRDHLLPAHGGTDVDGFLLGNLIYATQIINPIGAGEAFAEAGEPDAVAGFFSGYLSEIIGTVYVGGVERHPYYTYIGGETFPNTVDIPASRRTEFERLIRSIYPEHLWIVLRVRYI